MSVESSGTRVFRQQKTGALRELAGDVSFPNTRQALRQLRIEDRLSVGAQVAVSTGSSEAVLVVDGTGAPGRAMEPDMVFKLYCAGKPLLAIGAAHLVEEGMIQLDAPLSRDFREFATLGKEDLTYRQVLNHTAGLHRLFALHMARLTVASRHRAVVNEPLPPDWIPGVQSGYSEYSAWHALGTAVEHITGEPLGSWLRHTVLDPIESKTMFVCIDHEELRELQPKLGVNFDLSGPEPVPFLFDRSEQFITEWNPSFGAYGSARDLMSMFRAMLDCLDDKASGPVSPSVAREFWGSGHGAIWDHTYKAPYDFALGVAFDLNTSWGCASCSTTSFGQSGLAGSAFGFADPEAGIAAAVVLNGFIPSAHVFGERRQRVVEALYTDFGIGGTS